MDHRCKGWMKLRLGRLFRIAPFLCHWRDKGYFSTRTRKQRFVNWFFKAVFRINADCPWSVHYTSRVEVPEKISIGEAVERSFMFSGGCYIQGGNGIEIGDSVIFAPGVKIISANHDKHNLNAWCEEQPIRIGKGCWIGASAIVLPGVQLGAGVTVGAGAVVTRDVPSGATVVGNPARLVRAADSARDMGI